MKIRNTFTVIVVIVLAAALTGCSKFGKDNSIPANFNAQGPAQPLVLEEAKADKSNVSIERDRDGNILSITGSSEELVQQVIKDCPPCKPKAKAATTARAKARCKPAPATVHAEPPPARAPDTRRVESRRKAEVCGHCLDRGVTFRCFYEDGEDRNQPPACMMSHYSTCTYYAEDNGGAPVRSAHRQGEQPSGGSGHSPCAGFKCCGEKCSHCGEDGHTCSRACYDAHKPNCRGKGGHDGHDHLGR